MNITRGFITVVALLVWTQCSDSSINEIDGPTQITITEDYTQQTNGNTMPAELDSGKSHNKHIPNPQFLVEIELTQIRSSIAQSAKERSLNSWNTLAPQLEMRLAKRNHDFEATVQAM